MNELLEGTNIEKAIHLVRVCKVTAYKASKLYGVKSGTTFIYSIVFQINGASRNGKAIS
jgi:hypothetical protein